MSPQQVPVINRRPRFFFGAWILLVTACSLVWGDESPSYEETVFIAFRASPRTAIPSSGQRLP